MEGAMDAHTPTGDTFLRVHQFLIMSSLANFKRKKKSSCDPKWRGQHPRNIFSTPAR